VLTSPKRGTLSDEESADSIDRACGLLPSAPTNRPSQICTSQSRKTARFISRSIKLQNAAVRFSCVCAQRAGISPEIFDSGLSSTQTARVAGNHALNGDGGRAFTRPHFFETNNAHARESRFGQFRTRKLRNSARICNLLILSECR